MKKISVKMLLIGIVLMLVLGAQVTAIEFNEAPMLKDLTKEGKLPSVENRLPNQEDIYIVNPIEKVGKYGGTLRTTTLRAEGYGSDTLMSSFVNFAKPNAEANGVVPHLAKKIEANDDMANYIVSLRKGVRWSDGQPFTADDIIFWYEDVLLNKDLTPVIGKPWKIEGEEEIVKVNKLDDYTVEFNFPGPRPYFRNRFVHMSSIILPKHYIKQFHPKYTSEEDLNKKVEDNDFDHWYQLFDSKNRTIWGTPITSDRPVLSPYILVEKSSSRRIYERNPYFWKVDTEGNQLPYIDRIEADIVSNKEVIQGKVMSGEVDFVGFGVDVRNYPMYKSYEQKGGYKTVLWESGYGSQVVYFVNLTHEDPVLKEVFQDERFRKALSLGINRDEINDTIYYGKAKPRQFTVLDSSRYFEEEFATSYIEFNPDRANRLLDEMGLNKKNNEGYRLRPDGKKLIFTIEYAPDSIPTAVTPNVELVSQYWRELGLDIKTKQISGELQAQRATGNLMDATVWCDGSATDINFPYDPRHVVPTSPRWEECTFTEWSKWFNSNGANGLEPPNEIKELRSWWDQMTVETSREKRIELAKKILSLQAEKIWAIGTIGNAPRPAIISKDIRNFPDKGYWAWATTWTMSHDPEQLFFDK